MTPRLAQCSGAGGVRTGKNHMYGRPDRIADGAFIVTFHPRSMYGVP